MTDDRRIRVLIAKPGLDGHDRGARIIAYGLRDAGFEVIYTGLRQSPEEVVRAAIDEDVDVVGLSVLSGAHLGLTKRIVELLREQGADEVTVLVGGLIPAEDFPALRAMGVAGVFTAGTPIGEVAAFIKSHAAAA